MWGGRMNGCVAVPTKNIRQSLLKPSGKRFSPWQRQKLKSKLMGSNIVGSPLKRKRPDIGRQIDRQEGCSKTGEINEHLMRPKTFPKSNQFFATKI